MDNQTNYNLKKSNIGKFTISNKKAIIISMVIFILLFAGLIGYTSVSAALKNKEYMANTYNHRESVLLKENLRGNIYGSNGEILATSIQNSDGSQTRIYPYGSLFAHAIGFSTVGKTGVEASSNYYLLNTACSPMQKAMNKQLGNLNPGNNVYTTLDVKLQQIADEYLGDYSGAVIVTEVKTGKVLVMISHPDFDPNNIDKIWDSTISNDDSSILINRVTQGLYPPGSTFKIITSLEYYRENQETYNKYSFECPGYYMYDGYKINCYHGTVHGMVDFNKSFAKSCNASYANIGMSLDRNEFNTELERLLFNTDLPGDFTITPSSIKINDDITTYEMLQASIGQGATLMSPYHLNLVTMTIANNGILMNPYIVDRVENCFGHTIKTYYPEEFGRLIKLDEAEFLQNIMEDVVEEGTATRLQSVLYTAAGKTGSAEFNLQGQSHAWFTGYAPADDPEIAITVIVEAGGSGGEKAVPLAKLIFDEYFSR